jgi:sulfite reductase (ferredoxin)
VSGCPNSCAQHQACDIGLAGGKVRINGVTRLGYTVFAGADLARGRVGTSVGRVADEDVESVVDGLIGVWEVLRHPGERLGDTVERIGPDAFAAHVASIAAGFAPGDDPETSVAAVATAD